jgi:hypothetical protein
VENKGCFGVLSYVRVLIFIGNIDFWIHIKNNDYCFISINTLMEAKCLTTKNAKTTPKKAPSPKKNLRRKHDRCPSARKQTILSLSLLHMLVHQQNRPQNTPKEMVQPNQRPILCC